MNGQTVIMGLIETMNKVFAFIERYTDNNN